jgi:hypothetical protein
MSRFISVHLTLTMKRDDGLPRNVLAREVLENLRKFPHCLLLTRVGQFYEVMPPTALPMTKYSKFSLVLL